MNLFKDLLISYNRALIFNANQREYFYLTLREFTRSRFALMDIFTTMQTTQKNFAIQAIAKQSKKAIRNSEPFAANYAELDLFHQEEINLLIVGEQHNCLETVIGILLSPHQRRQPIIEIMAPAMQWVMMSLLMTLIGVYTAPTFKRFFTSGYELYFGYIDLVTTHWSTGLFALLTIILLHITLKNRIRGRQRRILRLFGIYKLYDMMIEARFLALSSHLFGAKLPAKEYLDMMIGTFGFHKDLSVRMQRARKRLKEYTLLDNLKDLISSDNYSHIIACAPTQTPEELGAGFEAAKRMHEYRIQRRIRQYQLICSTTWLIIALLVTAPFVYISMGSGMSVGGITF